MEKETRMKQKKINYYRITLQWIVLLLLAYLVFRPVFDIAYTSDYEAYCPLGGMQALSSYLVTNTLACSMTSLQICIALALILAVIIFSKLFCSYVCPVGTFTEWIGKIGERLKIRYTIKGIPDRVFRIFKYALLFITFYFTIDSSELFCKKYDPYYAAFSAFNTDVVILYAVISIAVVVLGSLFLRQFWCKYLCPLSAATNIFSNFILFAFLTGIYLILVLAFKLDISWMWYLGAVTLLAFFKEAFMMRTKVFPLLKVTRNPDTCTLCRKCDKVCPMAIKISESGAVDHIDCHMCGDCIVHCPEKDVLKINRRKMRWLPPAAVVILTAAAIWFASYTEIPTISERWGTTEQMETAQTFTISGLKNIKCYGSSMSFAEQMKNVNGILGVETFVGSHSVKIFYDPNLINEEQIKEAIFNPSKVVINDPGVNSKIGMVNLKIENYFDAYDEYYLTELLTANSDIYAFSTSFGEPVHALVYFNSEKLNSKQIVDIIESPEIILKDGETETIKQLNFKVSEFDKALTVITREDFYNIIYTPINDKFNKFESYASGSLSLYEIPVIPFGKTEGENLAYLESHVSGDNGVVAMKSFFRNDTAFIRMTFVKSMTDTEKIFQQLIAKKFTIYYSDGTSEEVDNVFNFQNTK
jgi:polyferredoxin